MEKAEEQEERRKEMTVEAESCRARERRFKGKKEEVVDGKGKARKERGRGREIGNEIQLEGREHGEPVAASARQLEAQLQPGAVTSTLQRAVAVPHGKASRFASDNGAAIASSRLPYPLRIPTPTRNPSARTTLRAARGRLRM